MVFNPAIVNKRQGIHGAGSGLSKRASHDTVDHARIHVLHPAPLHAEMVGVITTARPSGFMRDCSKSATWVTASS